MLCNSCGLNHSPRRACYSTPAERIAETSNTTVTNTGTFVGNIGSKGGVVARVYPNDNLWFDWYSELAKILYGETGVPSHKQVVEDFTMLRALLAQAVDDFTSLAIRYQMPSFVADLVKHATPLLRAADRYTDCPECNGPVWSTKNFPDAQHKPGCKSKPSWSDLGLPS